MKIIITPGVEDDIKELLTYPGDPALEECAVLYGLKHSDELVEVQDVRVVPNRHETPETDFAIWVSDARHAGRELLAKGLVVVGSAHTHPSEGSTAPSAADLDGIGPGYVGAVFSPSKGRLTWYTDLGPYPMHLNNIPPLPKTSQDWITFYSEGKKYEVNLSWVVSNWTCLFGNGCIGCVSGWGTKTDSDVGCCFDGAPVESREEVARVQAAAEQLTTDDLPQASLDYIAKHGWLKTFKDTDEEFHGRTRVRDGGCVFLNREKDGTGRIGCAFHHMAKRTGQHHTDLVPDMCYQLPLGVESGFDPVELVEVVRLVPWDKGYIGQLDETTDDLSDLGWWCVNTPDAYVGDKALYKSMEREFRKVIGDAAYEEMERQIVARAGNKAAKMPGQVRNEGRPMLPLFVEAMERIKE